MSRKLVPSRVRRPGLVTGACLSLAAGMFLARRIGPPAWLAVPVVLLIPAYLKSRGIGALLILCVLSACVGWWRGSVFVRKLAVNEVFYGTTVTVVGQAAEEGVYGTRSQLVFTVRDATVTGPSVAKLTGSLTVRGFGVSAVYRGDVVSVTGKLVPTRGNNVASISFAKLAVLRRGDSPINSFRRKLTAGVYSALPEPMASFALGLLIGQRSTLPEDVTDQLRRAGLTHIVAVSGYNLTIIVQACRRLFERRSKFQTAAACAGLVALFLLLTGFSPPVVRAAVVSILGLCAWYDGRDIKPLVLLLTSAAITVLANPLYLWGNVSWYMSFLAFSGVLIVAPMATKRWLGDREPNLLASVLIESLCASIMVLPYGLYIFGTASAVSLAANLLVVPFIPPVMLLSALTAVSGMVAAPLAGWAAWPANILLTYMLDTAAVLSRLPGAYAENVGFPLWALVASYAVIVWCAVILGRAVRRRTARPPGCAAKAVPCQAVPPVWQP